MNRNLIISVSVFVIILIGGYLLFTQSTTDVEVGEIAEEAEIPEESVVEPYPGVSWEQVGLREEAFFMGQDEIPLPGRQWEASLEGLTEEELNSIGFREHYTGLLDEGWSETVEIEGQTVGPIAADAPYASMWGYMKVRGDFVETVVLSMTTTGELLSGEDEPILYGPPFRVDFGMFVSTPLPAETILPAS